MPVVKFQPAVTKLLSKLTDKPDDQSKKAAETAKKELASKASIANQSIISIKVSPIKDNAFSWEEYISKGIPKNAFASGAAKKSEPRTTGRSRRTNFFLFKILWNMY